jgi:hypothetical protein
MSAHPTPADQDLEGAPPPHASFARLKPNLRARYDNVSGLVGPGALDFKYAHAGWAGEVYTRVRRYAIVEELKRNGFANCSHGIPRRRDGEAAYAAALFGADFVVSPQGKGRACHRDWEALAAGAIPLVDWDPSPAMAELYDGLPVVRVADWRRVTPAFLDSEFARIAASAPDLRKLYLPFWIAEFTAHIPKPGS